MEELHPTEYLSAFVDALLRDVSIDDFKEHMQKSLQAYKYPEGYIGHAEILFARVLQHFNG